MRTECAMREYFPGHRTGAVAEFTFCYSSCLSDSRPYSARPHWPRGARLLQNPCAANVAALAFQNADSLKLAQIALDRSFRYASIGRQFGNRDPGILQKRSQDMFSSRSPFWGIVGQKAFHGFREKNCAIFYAIFYAVFRMVRRLIIIKPFPQEDPCDEVVVGLVRLKLRERGAVLLQRVQNSFIYFWRAIQFLMR